MTGNKELYGRVHSFETFGTVDGPGIRFVVFMQGCPLRCLYCHNRDTWDPLGGKQYTVDEIIDQVSKYMNYIKASGGGITVTGGEPVLQADFVAELFKRCREIGVHTALDTSGFADMDRVRELLCYTDLILLDIKHAVDEKHRAITGVGNSRIREFAFYAAQKGIPIWIRYVLIPGYTDGEEDLKPAAEFISQIKTVEKIEVLPYHSMGAFKWDKLGQKYLLEGVESPTEEQVKKARDILESGKSVD
ncbi:pyruvate formate lyase activating enzyme [Anaerobacterium chartisolvens]|uniref:Pyruvate formate-lyase-activating enzyme n=1 Tax=Anaerobacterium chartisolvens TaxID=1297424 RepID=A0A369BBL6_9FIRM|nr:pyruvate formate-lyase-activating protein [Anaerobacterium chartisolvens]RCX18735.1 pyruvate formate lyase activating enzyme [Anaerobacterium chartisolvens]